MSATAVLDWRQEYREFCGPSVEDLARPKDPRTRLSLGEHVEASVRKESRRGRKEAQAESKRHKFVPQRRTLTRLEQIRLQNGTIDIKQLHGCKKAKWERKQILALRKQQPPKYSKAGKAARAARQSEAIPSQDAVIDRDVFETLGMLLVLLTVDKGVRFEAAA